MATMAGTEVGNPSRGKSQHRHISLRAVSHERRKMDVKGKCQLLRVTQTLSPENGRSLGFHFILRFLTQHFQQTNWLGGIFFLFLGKHLQSWKEIKTVILQMKTKQCSKLDDWAIREQSSASCWVPGAGPLGLLVKSMGTARIATVFQRLIFSNSKMSQTHQHVCKWKPTSV